MYDHGSGKCGQARKHPQRATNVWHKVRDGTEDDLGNESDGSLRSRHQCRLRLRVAKAGDDERVEVGDTGVGDGLRDDEYTAISVRSHWSARSRSFCDSHNDPVSGLQDSLFAVLPVELLRVLALLVSSESGSCSNTLSRLHVSSRR